MIRVVWFLLLAGLMAGCATSAERARYAQAEAALRQDPAFVRAYNACVRRHGGYQYHGDGWVGILNQAEGPGLFLDCMERAGWVQRPRWNPAAIGRYERRT